MTENTKKWLTVAGCLVVCAILVAVIASRNGLSAGPDCAWAGLYMRFFGPGEGICDTILRYLPGGK